MNRELLDKVLHSPRLPSLPTVALEVIDLTQRPDVSIDRIADAVRHDPALSTKLLKTVNSSFYGQAQTISTISRALVVLGLNAVKTLALGFSLVGNLKGAGGTSFDHVGYWRRSLYTAAAARTLSQRVDIARREEAFLGGLLQDLGMVAMNQALGDEYRQLLEKAGAEHSSLCALEQEAFGTDHAEVGGALAEKWQLPPTLVAPIRYHESPDAADEEILPLVRSVALGNRVAEIFLSEEGSSTALDTYHTQAAAWFDVHRDVADQMLSEVHQQTNEMSRLFDLPTGDLGNPDEILARANEALTQMTLQSQMHSTQLEQQNKQLVDEVNTDPLTGASNRRAFDAFVAECFEAARENQPVSVLFSDIDHFKRFNDKHGHAVGDRVLKVFAETLRESVGERGKVFRYGGEEFAVVCPGTDAEAGAMLAEHARRTVELSARVRARDCNSPLTVTCSIGVATHDGRAYDSSDALVRAADKAVYIAKSEGRNCIRVSGSDQPAPLSTRA